ncbi:MAG TPA: O-antigen ligase family protein [Solirubrobacteraceae bacterium]
MANLTASARRAPATVPAIGALVLFVIWSTDQAGFPMTHWAPGGLIVLLLLALALWLVPLRLASLPLSVRVALGCLAAYTAFSFLTILWAGVSAEAWEGADRTLLYLLVFALFACWRQQGGTAALLLVGWVLALVGVAVFTLLHLEAASSAGLQTLVPGGRLEYPTGYANANAAQWLMAFWPALLMARSERLTWPLRALLAGGAALLADVALLSQSRGSLFATPVILVLVFALLPGRVRTFVLLVPVGGAIALAARPVLRVGDRLNGEEVVLGTLHHAVKVSFASAVVAAVLVGVGAFLEGRLRSRLSGDSERRVHRGLAAIALVCLVGVVAGGLAAAGNPVTRLEKAWHSFKGGYTSTTDKDRLLSGLGSNRYDFYRVALNEFVAHPVGGIGVDNFQQQYLRHGRSTETPRYPHSVELRALVETGLVGTLIAVAGLIAALLAVARALRGRGAGRGRDDDRLAAAVAAAALAGFGYWFVHGSVDWLWEFAGLGAPAFALLGLACSLAPRGDGDGDGDDVPGVDGGSERARRSLRLRASRATLAGAAVLLLLALGTIYSLASPWLSQLEVQSAARIWPRAPRKAYARLEEAASLNPLSDEPYRVAGSIALRFGETGRAARQFTLALGRSPEDAYATLELGAIASSRGEHVRALTLLTRAAALNPREPLPSEALAIARKGGKLSVDGLNRSILLKARKL